MNIEGLVGFSPQDIDRLLARELQDQLETGTLHLINDELIRDRGKGLLRTEVQFTKGTPINLYVRYYRLLGYGGTFSFPTDDPQYNVLVIEEERGW